VWDVKTGAEVLTLKGHTGFVISASWSPDGSRLVTGSEDQTAKVWDAKTGAEVLTLKGHINAVSAASWSLDEVLTLKGHTGGVVEPGWVEGRDRQFRRYGESVGRPAVPRHAPAGLPTRHAAA
jgi:WD40 repeat protein